MSAVKPERKSMRGMGAEAFLGMTAEPQNVEEIHQITGIPVQRDADKEVEKQNSAVANPDASTEVIPQNSVQVTQDGDREANHIVGLPLYQETSMTVKKSSKKPVKKHTAIEVSQDVDYVKVSYYITNDQDLKLDDIRIARKRRGIKIDKSGLIREAIDRLKE